MGFCSSRSNFPVDRNELVEVVLACDPTIIHANPGAARFAYRFRDSDPSKIEIPEGATLVRFRALSRVDRSNAEMKAGPIPNVGQRLFLAALESANAASRGAEAAALAGIGQDVGDVVGDALARHIDALPEADQGQVVRFRAWMQRRNAEVVRRAVVAVVLGTDPDTGEEDIIEAGPEGFPVEDFARGIDLTLARAQHDFAEGRADVVTATRQALRAALSDVAEEARHGIVEAIKARALASVPAAVREAVEAMDAADAMAWVGATDSATVIEEMAHHITTISTLGKGGRTCSSTRSGAGTATTSRPAGTAVSA